MSARKNGYNPAFPLIRPVVPTSKITSAHYAGVNAANIIWNELNPSFTGKRTSGSAADSRKYACFHKELHAKMAQTRNEAVSVFKIKERKERKAKEGEQYKLDLNQRNEKEAKKRRSAKGTGRGDIIQEIVEKSTILITTRNVLYPPKLFNARTVR
ncbi:hypothetical protein TrVE_jg2377 [Triparma verrucosa]|uniref:Uncharacterized protein n=1 Tax=Triparma verrucosa TaxID=1606542 RepID=A0A9W7BCN1_9STRA|nr:hypothetical protein TrVE_jg2377 [Triparma verrucosa]